MVCLSTSAFYLKGRAWYRGGEDKINGEGEGQPGLKLPILWLA